MIGYVYYFENINKEIIYVGQTKDIETRMRTHFGSSGHLNPQCYNETCNVYYSELKSLNEAKMYEIYYIAQFKPKYNTANLNDGDIYVSLPPLDFKTYDIKKCTEFINNQILSDMKQVLSEESAPCLKSIKESVKILEIHCKLDVGLLTKDFRCSAADKQVFEGHNKILKYNTEKLLSNIDQLDKILSYNVET
jgi:predicted GIY-YIG superfamily endonuclease